MKCNACPFNDGITEDATIGQNLGCLPSAGQMIEFFDKNGISISCHENDKKVCRGLCEVRQSAKKKKVKSYSDWYRGI